MNKYPISFNATWEGTEWTLTNITYYNDAGDVVTDTALATQYSLAEGVTDLGHSCFRLCTSLVSIVIPNTISSFGTYMFDGCTSLRTINIPTGLLKLTAGCFRGCSSLESIEIPDTITSIDRLCFENCTSLESIIIPESVTTLGDDCFGLCTSINSVVFSGVSKLTSLTGFFGCSGITSFNIPESVKTLGTSCFNGTGLESIVLSENITSLGTSCFYGCTSLTSINIPESVTYLGNNCFNRCTGLSSFTIPTTITMISTGLLEGCSGISVIEIPENITYLGNNCFKETGITSLIMPDTITYCGDGCFEGCENLESITLSNNISLIGNNFFNGCSSLVSISIPSKVYLLKSNCFKGCSSLVSIALSNTITTIGSGCFDGCSSLSSIVLPNSINSLGDRFFADCRSLVSYTIPNNISTLGTECFSGCSSLETVTMHSGISTLSNRCFSGCVSFVSFDIPENIISIGDECFSGCSGLTTIELGEHITSIGNSCFSDCSSLSSISVLSPITLLGNDFFKGCTSLTSYIIPTQITSLGNNCFSGCSGLSSIEFHDNIVSFGEGCFSGCTSLESVNIPKGVSRLENNCFSECSMLSSIVLGENIKYLGNYCFLDCTAISSVGIPDNLETLEEGCFSGCSSISTIYIPKNIITIGDYCFSRCSSLRSSIIPSNTVSLGSNCFSGCDLFTFIEIPKSVETIGENCFIDCPAITYIYTPADNVENLKTIMNVGNSDQVGIVFSEPSWKVRILSDKDGEFIPISHASSTYIYETDEFGKSKTVAAKLDEKLDAVLPTEITLGGIKASPKTENDVVEVKIDPVTGKTFVAVRSLENTIEVSHTKLMELIESGSLSTSVVYVLKNYQSIYQGSKTTTNNWIGDGFKVGLDGNIHPSDYYDIGLVALDSSTLSPYAWVVDVRKYDDGSLPPYAFDFQYWELEYSPYNKGVSEDKMTKTGIITRMKHSYLKWDFPYDVHNYKWWRTSGDRIKMYSPELEPFTEGAYYWTFSVSNPEGTVIRRNNFVTSEVVSVRFRNMPSGRYGDPGRSSNDLENLKDPEGFYNSGTSLDFEGSFDSIYNSGGNVFCRITTDYNLETDESPYGGRVLNVDLGTQSCDNTFVYEGGVADIIFGTITRQHMIISNSYIQLVTYAGHCIGGYVRSSDVNSLRVVNEWINNIHIEAGSIINTDIKEWINGAKVVCSSNISFSSLSIGTGSYLEGHSISNSDINIGSYSNIVCSSINNCSLYTINLNLAARDLKNIISPEISNSTITVDKDITDLHKNITQTTITCSEISNLNMDIDKSIIKCGGDLFNVTGSIYNTNLECLDSIKSSNIQINKEDFSVINCRSISNSSLLNCDSIDEPGRDIVFEEISGLKNNKDAGIIVNKASSIKL